MTCLDDAQLAAWHEGRLEGEALLATRAHVDSCDDCQRLVAAYEGAFGDGGENKKERYRLIDILGAGAMGIVHRAHDSQLERLIALKVLRANAGIEEERLVREARAMAKLRHAHAVTVFDAGRRQDGTAFVAMELIEGTTLREWLASGGSASKGKKPSVEAILRVFAQAASALGAAHALGIVHRDFKPDNVLVTKEGEAKVADFGLARAMKDDSAKQEGLSPPSSKSANAPLTKLTKHGTVIGTPAYMAPEQHDGKDADARADQFAFFVALYEALTGVRPFPGETPKAVRLSIARGVEAQAIARLPRSLRGLIERGLKENPADRHASMMDVARALAVGEGPKSDPRRPRLLLLAAGFLATCGVFGFGFYDRLERQRLLVSPSSVESPACVALADRLKTGVSAADKTAALASFEKTKLPFAKDAHARFVARLDAYVSEIEQARVMACGGAASEAQTKGEVECLGLLASDATSIAKHAHKVRDRAGIEGAILAARSLEPPAICRGALADPPPDDAAVGHHDYESADDADGIARMLFEVRLSVAPPTPSTEAPSTKRGLLSLIRVLRVRVHEPEAFTEEAGWDDFNETLAILPTLVKRDIDNDRRAADRAAELALLGAKDAGGAGSRKRSGAADAGGVAKPDPILALLARAVAGAEKLHLEALRAEALVLRTEHLGLFGAEPKGIEEPNEELLALVSRSSANQARLASSIDLLLARKAVASEGRLPRMPSIERAATSMDAAARLEWADALVDRGELVRDRQRAEIDVVLTTADAAWGSWHSRSATARVQTAEWLVARGINGPAKENAIAARDVLREMRGSSSRHEREHVLLLTRALSVLAFLTERNAEAMLELDETDQGVGGSSQGRASRPDYIRARILLDRMNDPKLAARAAAKSAEAAARNRDVVATAEANALLAEATWTSGDKDGSAPLFAKALATVSLLAPPERARLRLAAARRLASSGDLGVARALAEQAEADDPEAARTLLHELKR